MVILEEKLKGFRSVEGIAQYIRKLAIKGTHIPEEYAHSAIVFFDGKDDWESAAAVAEAAGLAEDAVKFNCYSGLTLNAAKVAQKLGSLDLAIEYFQHARRPDLAMDAALNSENFSQAVRVLLRNQSYFSSQFASTGFLYALTDKPLDNYDELAKTLFRVAARFASETTSSDISSLMIPFGTDKLLTSVLKHLVNACQQEGQYYLGKSLAELASFRKVDEKEFFLNKASELEKLALDDDCELDLTLTQKYTARKKTPKNFKSSFNPVPLPVSYGPYIQAPTPDRESIRYKVASGIEKQADDVAKTDPEKAKEMYENVVQIYIEHNDFEHAGRVMRCKLKRPVDAVEIYERGIILHDLTAGAAEEAGLLEKALEIRIKEGRYDACAVLAEKLGKSDLVKEYWVEAMKQSEEEGFLDSASTYARKAGLIDKAFDLANRAVELLEQQELFRFAGELAAKFELFDRALLNFERAGLFGRASSLANRIGSDRASFYKEVYSEVGMDDF